MCRPTRSLSIPLLLAALWLSASPVMAAASGKQTRAVTAQKKLDAVRAQIRALAASQRNAAAQRDRINRQLAKQADTLAAAARAVHQVDADITRGQHRLGGLQQQREALQDKLKDQRAALAELLRAAYALGQGSDLRLLLGDQDIAHIARGLAYSHYFQRDRVARIHTLLGDLAQLQTLQRSIQTEQATLKATRTRRRQRLLALSAARRQQQQLLAKAERDLHSQSARLHALRQREHDLDALVARLRNVFADIPHNLPSDVPFAHLRGRLPWPAHGAVHRSGAGEVIRTHPGSDVHAVAHGRVAYAAWLRGYGMLVIVDHGHGWMTLYGNNESVLKSVGDWVNAGDVVATSGAVANGRTGVYFELRHHGKPVNPKHWLRKR